MLNYLVVTCSSFGCEAMIRFLRKFCCLGLSGFDGWAITIRSNLLLNRLFSLR